MALTEYGCLTFLRADEKEEGDKDLHSLCGKDQLTPLQLLWCLSGLAMSPRPKAEVQLSQLDQAVLYNIAVSSTLLVL